MKLVSVSVGLVLVCSFLIASSVSDANSLRRLSLQEERQLQGGGYWSGKFCDFLQGSCSTAGPAPGQACIAFAPPQDACYTTVNSYSCNDSFFYNDCVGDANATCPLAVRLHCAAKGTGWEWTVTNPQPANQPSCGTYRNCI